ncbi:hypothetical protein GOBAR_DD22601 [Gossypium barbadense]|nr:hypothetical protein GOBAR_DD22601 [Gossypium barbadense]
MQASLLEIKQCNPDIAKNHQVRKKYTIQLGENELVLKELDLLNEDANVYKLIGPVLVKQDLAEANANVRKRIEYISAELKRLDGSLQDLEEKQHSKREAAIHDPHGEGKEVVVDSRKRTNTLKNCSFIFIPTLA